MITMNQLTRRYGDVVAVDGVTTTIDRGEIVGLLGHNGAGKTTVMKILTGYLEASDGSVTVDGLDVASQRRAVQARIGYLPENAPLYEEMTVSDYLWMMAELRGVPEAHRPRFVSDAVLATDLARRVDQRIGTLSKGLRQRVGIAQAILHKPDVLVLDEPTNGLDPMQIEAIRELIRRLGQDTTILLSTHILQEIEAVCDRVLVMIDGHLAADASLSELLDTARVLVVLGRDNTDAARVLGRVEGVTGVDDLGDRDDGRAWAVRWHGNTAPVPGLIEAARSAGFTIHAIAPEHRTLETVFKELQRDHISRRGGAA